MYASQKVRVYSSVRGPESHFTHAQALQRAGALGGSIDII